jgi:malate synthase
MAVVAQHFAQDPLEWRDTLCPGFDAILTPATVEFLAQLHRRFDPARRARSSTRT